MNIYNNEYIYIYVSSIYIYIAYIHNVCHNECQKIEERQDVLACLSECSCQGQDHTMYFFPYFFSRGHRIIWIGLWDSTSPQWVEHFWDISFPFGYCTGNGSKLRYQRTDLHLLAFLYWPIHVGSKNFHLGTSRASHWPKAQNFLLVPKRLFPKPRSIVKAAERDLVCYNGSPIQSKTMKLIVFPH